MLLGVVRKPADRPAITAYLNRDLDKIQQSLNHWFVTLNPNKTKALVVSRSKTVNLPHGDLVLSGISIRATPNLVILAVKFDNKLTFEDNLHGIVSRVSQRNGILRLVKLICVDTSLLLCFYFAVVLPILEYYSRVGVSASECHLQLLESQVYSVATIFPDQSFLSLCLLTKYILKG